MVSTNQSIHSSALSDIGIHPLPDAQMTVFTEGDALFDAMLKAIYQAKHDIRFTCYIFLNDVIGWRFAQALAEKAREGVNVRLQIDAHGSLFQVTRAMRKYLRENGVHMKLFHRWRWRTPHHYNYRDHRKLIVIDSNTLFIGGFNIDARNSLEVYGEDRWRDTHLLIEGRLAKQATILFDCFWEGDRLWRRAWAQNGHKTHLISNHNLRYRHKLRRVFAQAWHKAQQSIYVTTPYFVPDLLTQRGLIRAAKRGVDVRLMVPRKTDVKITRWAARAAYAHLLHAGVKIYEYLPRMLHSKTMVVDGHWSSVGTANLDYRSFSLNYELNIVSTESTLAQCLTDLFLSDIEQSEQMCATQWPDRHWSERITETIGWIARRWL